MALNELAEGVSAHALAQAAADLSTAYRGAADASGAISSPLAAIAYAVTRLPATWAALAETLAESRRCLPNWRPASLLDLGAGPGGAVWAAGAVWPTLARATLLERDQRMMEVGRRLLRAAPDERAITWRQTDIAADWGRLPDAPFDLCVCSYALNELPHERRIGVVERLWAACGGALALVAPGTPSGFAAIREARAWLIDAGAHIVAPCPHAEDCPMPPGDWCHFSRRLARSRLHRQLKGGAAPYEDEKFSYIVAARSPGAAIAARVIRHPIVRPGHISLELCAPAGLLRADVTRAEHDAWRAAREAEWGSALAKLPTKTRDR
ncbi:MAG TPA: small ribosomal subunit Rsm22 family protein [Ktedonobacterales bacterium]